MDMACTVYNMMIVYVYIIGIVYVVGIVLVYGWYCLCACH
jgi:hypothetical protein